MNKVENIFGKVKFFKIFSTAYRNRRKRFGLRMNLIIEMSIQNQRDFKIIKTHIMSCTPKVRQKNLTFGVFLL